MALPSRFRDAPVSVFWDVEGVPPLPGVNPMAVLSKVESAIRSHGCTGALFLTAYGGPSLGPLQQALPPRKGINIVDFSKGEQAQEDCPHLVELLFWVLDNHRAPGVIAVISEDGSYSPILVKLKLRNYHVIVISQAAPEGTLDQVWDWRQLLSTGMPVPLVRGGGPEVPPPQAQRLQAPPVPMTPTRPGGTPSYNPFVFGQNRPASGGPQPATPKVTSASFPSTAPLPPLSSIYAPSPGPAASFMPSPVVPPQGPLTMPTAHGPPSGLAAKGPPNGPAQGAGPFPSPTVAPAAQGPPGVPFSLRLQLAAVLVSHEVAGQGPMRMVQIPSVLRQRFGTELDTGALGFPEPINLLEACQDVLAVGGFAPVPLVRPQAYLQEHATTLPQAAPILLALYDLQVSSWPPHLLTAQPSSCMVPVDRLVSQLAGMPDLHSTLNMLVSRQYVARMGDGVALGSHPFGMSVGTFAPYPTRLLLAPPSAHGPTGPFSMGMPPPSTTPGRPQQDIPYAPGLGPTGNSLPSMGAPPGERPYFSAPFVAPPGPGPFGSNGPAGLASGPPGFPPHLAPRSTSIPGRPETSSFPSGRNVAPAAEPLASPFSATASPSQLPPSAAPPSLSASSRLSASMGSGAAAALSSVRAVSATGAAAVMSVPSASSGARGGTAAPPAVSLERGGARMPSWVGSTNNKESKAVSKDFERDIETTVKELKTERLPPLSELVREAIQDKYPRDGSPAGDRVASATCNVATWEATLDKYISLKKLSQDGGRGVDRLIRPTLWKMWDYVKPDAKNSYSAQVWDTVKAFMGSKEGKAAVGAAQTRYAVSEDV
eukprot:jgi/Mesvir1/29420/Mv23003-RA.3